MLVKELVIVVMLLLPNPSTYVSWTVNEIPTQVQLKFPDGREASYPAQKVACGTLPNEAQLLLTPSEDSIQDCYLTDVLEPTFVRHPHFWLHVREVHQHDHQQNTLQGKPVRGWERFP